MRKALIFILSIMAVMLLAGCSVGEETNDPTETADDASSDENEIEDTNPVDEGEVDDEISNELADDEELDIGEMI